MQGSLQDGTGRVRGGGANFLSARRRAVRAAAWAVVLGAGVPAGAATINNGETLDVTGTANTAGLFGQYYALQQPAVAGIGPAGGTVTASPNFTAGGWPIMQAGLNQLVPGATQYTNVNFNNGNFGNAAPFPGLTATDNITARWSGYINLPAGVTTFATNSDDGSLIYIDGVRVVDNNNFQGNTRRIGQTANFAAAGQHEIVISFYEGTGGAGVEARYAPGVATTTVTDPAFVIIPVTDAGTNQILTGVQNTVLAPADPNVDVAAGAAGTLNIKNALQVNFGALTLNGGTTLNYQGAASRFTTTTLTGGGTNTIAGGTASNFNQDIALGQLSDGGTAATLIKTGPGQLVLDQTSSANTLSSGTVFNIQGGGLVLVGTNAGQNPIGAAQIRLGATSPSPAPAGVTIPPSTLSLTSKAGAVVFDNAVFVDASNLIVAQQLTVPGNAAQVPGQAVGVPTTPTTVANVTATLGSAGNAITVAGGATATFQANNGYTFDLAGPITGGGNVAFNNGVYTLRGGMSTAGTLTPPTGTSTFNLNIAGAVNRPLNLVGNNSIINFNVNNASGGNPVSSTGTTGQITINAAVTTIGTETFTVGATNGIVSIPNAAVAGQLTRGTNLNVPAGGIIAEQTAGANNAVQNLGTNADLLFGIAGTVNDSFTVSSFPGTTPWRGVATDRSARLLSGGTITAQSNFLIQPNISNAFDWGAVTIATPNGPVVANMNSNGGNGIRLRFNNANSVPLLNNNVVFAVQNSGLQLQVPNSLGASATAAGNARVVAYPTALIDPGTAGAMSGDIFFLNRSIFQINDNNNFGGVGRLTSEAGTIVQLQPGTGTPPNTNLLANVNATQTLATLSPGTVHRLEGSDIANLPTATNPAGNFQLHGGDRSQSAGVVLNAAPVNPNQPGASGFAVATLTNDGSSRQLNNSGAGAQLVIGPNGGTIAASSGTTITLNTPISVNGAGGRTLNVGTVRIIDPDTNNNVKIGTLTLNAAGNNFGSGSDKVTRLNLVGRHILQNSVAAGVATLPQGSDLAVGNGGVYQINGGTGAGASTVQLGEVTPLGGGVFALIRNATTPDAINLNLNAPINRPGGFGPGNRGALTFQVLNGQTIGVNDKVTFSAGSAPSRISVTPTAGGPTTIDMLPPWIVASNTAAAFASTFVDVAPGTESTTGLVPVTYVPGPTSGGTGTEIADYTAATAITGTVEVAAVRTNAALTGGTLKINSGGFLFSANTANPTLSTNLDFTGVEGVLQNVSGSANPIFSGIITAPNGFTKSGSNSVILNNPANNLSGGITINEANLRVGAANAFGTNDPVVTINAAGTMDLQNNQSIGGLRGHGQFTNTSTTARTLTINTATGTVFDFTGVVLGGSAAISVTKSGPGTQVFSGALAHTGATTVNGGLLQVNALSTAASAYTVNTGATLGGGGLITGAVTVASGGNLAPGASPGTLRTGNLTLSAGSNYQAELSGPAAGTGYDQVDVIGTVNVTGANLVATLNYAPSAGDLLYIINNDQLDFVTGTFANLPQGSTITLLSAADNQNYPFTISYTGEFLTGQYENMGNDVVLRSVVPEPSAVGLAGLAALGLLARRRRARVG